MHVSNMPPNRMNLSWCVRRSIRRNTVLDSPRVVSKSSILRWTPFNMPRWSRRFDSMFEPLCSSSSMPWFADWSLVLCCNAASIVIDVSSFGANIRDISSSRSRSSSSFWYLYSVHHTNEKRAVNITENTKSSCSFGTEIQHARHY